MTVDRIKDRVRKLLNLASNDAAAEGEIENALAFAQRLMDEHHIRESDVVAEIANDFDVAKEKMDRVSAYVDGARLARWEKTLSLAVAAACGVGVYQERAQTVRDDHGIIVRNDKGQPFRAASFRYYGIADECRMASELFSEMAATIMSMARLKYNTVYRGEGRSYAEGFATALHRRCVQEQKARANTTAIVIRDKQALAKRWLADECDVQLVSASSGAGGRHYGSAYDNGRADGRRASMSPNRRQYLGSSVKKLLG